MAFVSPLSLLNQEDSWQQPTCWVFLAWLGSLNSQRANTFAWLEQGRKKKAEREVRLLHKKVDGLSKWALAAIDVTCTSKLLCVLYSPKVAALSNLAANEAV